MRTRKNEMAERGFSRRNLIKGVAAVGLVAHVPGVGCGSDGAQAHGGSDPRKLPGDRPVERLHMHMDLSHVPGPENSVLHVGAREIPLNEHTDETRAQHRATHPALADVADGHLTHFALDVEMHADAVQTMVVKHTLTRDGRQVRGVALVAIHVPTDPLARARSAPRGLSANLGLLDAASTGPAFGHLTPAGGDPLTTAARYLHPTEAAKAILFHHPELMNLDPTVCAQIMAHIESAQGYDMLWKSIASQGAAYEHDPKYLDGWAVLDPVLMDDGTRRKDQNGDDLFSFRLSDQTLSDLQTAVKSVLMNTKDDTELAGISYRVVDGTASVDLTDPGTYQELRSGGGYDVTFDEAQDKAGLEMSATVSDASTRTVALSLKNYYIRSLHYCVQYLDGANTKIPLPADQRDGSNLDDYTISLETVGGPPTILGIPLAADVNTYQLKLPPEASQVLVLAGGLGTGRLSPYGAIARSGIISTIVFDYGLPVFFLAAGAYVKSTETFKNLMKDKELMLAVGAVGSFLVAGETAAEVAVNGPKVPLARLGNLMAGFLWSKGVELLKDAVLKQITEAELEKAVPFAGWAAWLLGSASTFAAMTETTVEVLSSPWVIQNKISTTMDIQVTVHPDLQNTHFPAVATYFVVKAVFSQKTPRIKRVVLPATTVSVPQVVTLTSVPAGGTVKISVGFYSDTDWLAGYAESEVLANLVPTGQEKLTVDLTITERKVPLTSTTQYSHKQKLLYAEGRHQWVAMSAPGTTRDALSCADNGVQLCELHGITFSQLTGMLGYAWRSSSSHVVDCSTQSGAVQTYQLQNVFSGAQPDDGLKTLTFTDATGTQRPCGFRSATHLVYDLMGPRDGMGNNFFVDATNEGYHLRKVVLDKTKGSFNRTSGQSFGRFTQPLDSMVLHPGGYVVGANWSRHKIEVLTIPEAPYYDVDAPIARVLAGRGARAGLLFGPQAVAMTADGAILVLESLNKRVQALDLNGDPIPRFGLNRDQPFVSLVEESVPVTYLDLGAEFEGYLYVLSFANQGSTAEDYRLDIYSPVGVFICRTTGVAAARLVVDLWRTMYTLGYDLIAGPQGRIEPAVSEWIPSTPPGGGQ